MKSLLLVLLLVSTLNAKASLLIEPAIGYVFNGTIKGDVITDEEDDFSGMAYGGRLGYQNMGFQLGVDYLHGTFTTDEADDEFVATDFGAFVGFKFPAFLRVYAGYIFSANAEDEDNDVTFSKGSGTKFGIGFTGLPLININLEYRSVTYTEFEQGTTELEEDTTTSGFMLGISLPIAF